MKKFIKGVRFTPSNYPDEIEDKIQKYRKQGYKLPPRKVLRTPEQIEGIRESAKINTALLNHIAENIREGMSTEEIDRLVYDFTTSHGAIPAPLNYEGFPKSVCTSINDVVCHGIPCSLCERKHSNPGNILSVKFVYRFPPRHPTESACMQRVFPRCTWVNCAMMHRCPFGASTIGRFCVSAEYWNVIGSPACGK
jgi:hypothetical protein